MGISTQALPLPHEACGPTGQQARSSREPREPLVRPTRGTGTRLEEELAVNSWLRRSVAPHARFSPPGRHWAAMSQPGALSRATALPPRPGLAGDVCLIGHWGIHLTGAVLV